MSTIKFTMLAIFALTVCGIAAPDILTQSALADDPIPRGHFLLKGVQVDPINRTKTADGKTSYNRSDTLTDSLRFDTRAITELVDGTKDLRYQILNPTVEMSMTVDKPIKYKGKQVPAGTNLLDYKEGNPGKSTIRMPHLNAMAIQSIRLTNDFVFPPDTYNIKFEWLTEDGDVISKDVSVIINIKPDAPKPVKRKPAVQNPIVQNPTNKYSFLVCGQKTYIAGADGKPSWIYRHKTRDGYVLDFAVYNYDATGKVIGKLDTTVAGDTEHKIHSWPFTAIRHGEGQTLVTCTNANRVVDFDASGKVTWTLTNEDLPGPWLKDPCGAQVLPNGNVVIASYAAGKSDPNAPKLFEVSRDKKVVWKYSDGKKTACIIFRSLMSKARNFPARR